MPETVNISQAWLLEQLKKRQSKNKFYSLRAFSRDLGLRPGRVSEVLTGKRVISRLLGKKICASLHLSEKECARFLELIATDLIATSIKKLSMEMETSATPSTQGRADVSMEKTIRIPSSRVNRTTFLVEQVFRLLESVLSSDKNSSGEEDTNEYLVHLEFARKR